MSHLLIFILTIILGFWLWRKFCYRSSIESYQMQDNKIQIDLMEQTGQQIINHVYLTQSMNPLKIIQPLLEKEILSDEFIPLLQRVVNIIIGKYKITDPITITYINNSMEAVLIYLAKTKDIDVVMREYDPSINNDLILEVCRDLMDCSSIDDSKKILVAQYIVNKTLDGDELEYVYNFISSTALNLNISPLVRAEAADILSLSNSTKYMKIANQALELLRQEDDGPSSKRSLRKPQGGQNTTYITGNKIGRQQRPRIPPVRHRVEERGDRNDLFIIPPIIIGDAGDNGLQQALWDQVGMRIVPKTERSVYEDGQSVHNTEINNSVLEAAKELVSNYRSRGMMNFNYQLLEKSSPSDRIKIDASLHRIITDPTTFKHGTTLHSIFQSLLHYIDQHPQKDELNIRLVQELIEMSSLCCSGHLSRLISVLQGFDTKKELKIKISIYDEVYGNLKHKIEKALQEDENSEEIMDDMISPEKKKFIKFVKDFAIRELPNIRSEYKEIASSDEILKSVITALDKYTKSARNFNDLSDVTPSGPL